MFGYVIKIKRGWFKLTKLIRVEDETWLFLGKLKRFPKRKSFDAVIKYLRKEAGK